MTVFQRRPRLTKPLPPAVVTPELYERLTKFASKNKASKSEVIRFAVEFFLSATSNKSLEDMRKIAESETE